MRILRNIAAVTGVFLIVAVLGVGGAFMFSDPAWVDSEHQAVDAAIRQREAAEAACRFGDYEPAYQLVKVDGLWFANVYMEATNLFEEPFRGRRWDWWPLNRSFASERAAHKAAQAAIDTSMARVAQRKAACAAA